MISENSLTLSSELLLSKQPYPGGWPDGWIEKRFRRTDGATATVGREDSYFYPPTKKEYQLRSIKEVQRFVYAIFISGGDLEFAFKQRKKGPTGPDDDPDAALVVKKK